jgi:hypothetical protein
MNQMPPLDPDILGGVMESLRGMVGADTIVLASKDSSGTDINKLVDDNICGLLSQEELTAAQVVLLSALLTSKGK